MGRLTLETGSGFAVGGEVRMEQLEGDLSLDRLLLPGAIDDAHAAFAEFGGDLVVADAIRFTPDAGN